MRSVQPIKPALFSLTLIVACFWGCGESDIPEAPADRYEVRGIVRQLPKGSTQELYIHHEAIPTFVNIDGEIEPMGSMAMPFPVADANLPQDLKAGDKVTFQFEVSWNGSPPLRLIHLEKLPPETLLAFEIPNKGDEETPDGEHEGHAMDHLGDEEHGGLGHGGGDPHGDGQHGDGQPGDGEQADN